MLSSTTTNPDLWTYLDPQPGYCCVSAYASRQGPQLHTSGCPHRCSRWVPVPDAKPRGLVGAYPCAYSFGHVGDCWLHPSYRLPDLTPTPATPEPEIPDA